MPHTLATPTERGLARIVQRLAVLSSVALATALTGGFFYLDYSRLAERAQTLAQVKAGALDALASDNPDLWKYGLVRVEEVLERGPFRVVDELVVVRDQDGQSISQRGMEPQAPVLIAMHPIHDFGREVGRVEVFQSYRAVLLRTLGVALLSGLLGLAVHRASLRSLPALRRLSAELAAEQAALRVRELRYRALFEGASDGILLLSEQGDIRSANRVYARMHGYREQDLAQLALEQFGLQDRNHLSPQRLRSLPPGEFLKFEVEHFHQNGRVFPVEASASLVEAEGDVLVQVFYRDVTERQRQANLIAEHNALLTRQKAALEATLARIRRLEGLISICAWCKKVRSEEDAWQELEQYVVEHTEANFTHGVCPDCMEQQLKNLR